VKTKSELLFEELCKIRGVSCELIDTTPESRRPDYRIWLNKIEVIVEVKQFEPGEFEDQLINQAQETDSDALVTTVVSRIRSKFHKAQGQIRNLSKGIHPSLFVIYDATNGLSLMDRVDILTAMYGDDILRIQYYKETYLKIKNAVRRFGGNRKLDQGHNRSISAFAWLRSHSESDISLEIYHNDFAEIPIDVNAATILASTQFRRVPSTSDEYREWEQIGGNHKSKK